MDVDNTTVRRWVAMSLAFTALATGAAHAQEISAPCSSGQVPMCYGERALCSISTPTEIDVYTFIGVAGEAVRITLGVTGGCMNPKVEVYKPDGALHSDPECGGGCVCSFGHNIVLDQSGIWTLAVFDSGFNNTGSYALDLQRIPPTGDVPTLDYGQTQLIPIDHVTDHDWLRIELLAGTHVRLTAGVQGGCFNPHVELFDVSGAPGPSNSCAVGCVCSLQIDFFPVQTSGTYFVALSDSGHDNTGTMAVTLSCIVGNCPPPNPPGPLGTSYCAMTVNSTGNPAPIAAVGSASVAANDLHLMLAGVPAGKVGIFFLGPGSANVPLFNSWGPRCVQAPITRLPIVFTCNDGTMHKQVDLTTLPMITPGSTWYFQGWFRDPAGPPPNTSNTSDGLQIDFL